MSENIEPKHWTEYLDEKQLKEIEFARVYSAHFSHGTPGHLDYIVISNLAAMLDELMGPAPRAIQKVPDDTPDYPQ